MVSGHHVWFHSSSDQSAASKQNLQTLCWCHSASDQSAATKQNLKALCWCHSSNDQPAASLYNKLMIGQIATECSYSDTLFSSIFS